MVADKINADEEREAVGSNAVGTKAAPSSAKRARSARRGPAATEAHMARALRTAYEQTVSEDVPAEFLDLLGKLA